MSQKLQISIYKIEDGETLESLSTRATGKNFTQQSLTAVSLEGYQLKLYYQRKTSNPKWKGFVGSIAVIGQAILQSNESSLEAFVLFLSKAGKLYAVTGGHGHFVIQDCINKDFGFEVLSRLIKKEDKVLKSTREKSLTGGVLGTTKYFRKNLNLFDNESFGKFYQELKASLEKSILIDKLGFTPEDIEKDLLCVAKSSFRIHKDISFEQLLKLLDGCESILEEDDQPIAINSVLKLSRKKDKTLTDKLDKELLTQLWQTFSTLPDSVDFDLCHDELEKYLTASYYEVSRGSNFKNLFDSHQFPELSNADVLFAALKSSTINPQDQMAFEKLIKNLTIASFNDDSVMLTDGKFLDHVLGDVVCEGRRYFYIDSVWYLITDIFIKGLNEHCSHFISKHYSLMPKLWTNSLVDENAYNFQYLGEKDTLVLDKITPENIEPCDILWWDESTLYLCHVKAGFHNTMRDLCSQIAIAANRINQDIMADKAFIRKIYQALKDKIGGDNYFDAVGKQTESIGEDDFVSLFSKNIVFLLAVLDTATTQRDIRNMESFHSNIAKFSLQELSKDMKMLDVGLSVAQIARD